MFKILSFFALVAVAVAAPGHLVETHALLQPAPPAIVAKTAVLDNTASSALTHQSFTNLVKKVPVVHTYPASGHLVKTVVHDAAPVIHAAPVVHKASIVHEAPVVHALQAVQAVHAAPAVHAYSTGHVHTIHSVPVLHSAPYAKTVVFAPAAFTIHH